MAREPKKLTNPVAAALNDAAEGLRAKQDNESAAILAGLGLDTASAEKAARAAAARGEAKEGAKRTRQVAEIRRQARTTPTPKGTLSLSGVPSEELRPTAKQAAAINKTLRGQGVTGITVPKPSKSRKSTTAGTGEYNEVGPGGIPDHFQALTNLATDLNRQVSKHEEYSTPDYKGHFERIRSIIADAHSDIMSAQGAHNQGRYTPADGAKLSTTSTEGLGNTRFNTRVNEGYQENYPRLAGEFGARNLNTEGKQFDFEPTSSTEYMKRAASGIKDASDYLAGLTRHVSDTPSVASPDVTPNTPVWEGHSEVAKQADKISNDYSKPGQKRGNPMMDGDTSIVERFQPKEGSQIERLFPGVTSRGRGKDVVAKLHQQYTENVINARRPVIPGRILEGPAMESGSFTTSGKSRLTDPVIAPGPVTAQGNFFSKDDRRMRASEETAREIRTGMRWVPSSRGRYIPEESISTRFIGPRQKPVDQGRASESPRDYTPSTPEEKYASRQRMAKIVPEREEQRRAAREAGLIPLSPYEKARAEFSRQQSDINKSIAEGSFVAPEVPKNTMIGPKFPVTERVGTKENGKDVEVMKFYSAGKEPESYKRSTAFNMGVQSVPPITDEQGERIPSMSSKEEAQTAASAAAYRHWQQSTGNVRPARPEQGMMSYKEYKPILDAHMKEVQQHTQAFRRSPAYRTPEKYLQSKGQAVPSTVEQAMGYRQDRFRAPAAIAGEDVAPKTRNLRK